MTVSFCVIAYNEEKSLPALLNDICSQDYPHEKMEVILVNAMSTDRTRQIMETFAKEQTGFIRVVVCDNPKRIQAAGWNVAIKASQCDIIMRIDAHTMIPKEFVSKNVTCIMGGEYVSGGRRPSIVSENTPWKHTLLLAETSMFGSSVAIYRRSHHKHYVKTVFHGAYRKEVFDKAGLFNENLGRTEDNEMHYRIHKAGYKICYTPDIVSYQHTRNTWRKMIRQKYSNGYWIGLTLGLCPECFSVYHFVPLCFVLALLLTGGFAIAGMVWPLLTLIGIYVASNLVMSVASVIKEKKYVHYFLLPVIFFSLHIAYGVGTLVGIIKMPFWLSKIKKSTKS